MNKKLIILSHCILNSYSKVENFKYTPPQDKLVKDLLNSDYAIMQLPCPENIVYGNKRWGHVKEQFDTPFYRKECRKLFEPYLLQIKDYIKNNVSIEGIISIEGSPSCGNSLTCSSKICLGELSSNPNLSTCISDIKMIKGRGIFMEEMVSILRENDINIAIWELDEENYTSLDNLKKISIY